MHRFRSNYLVFRLWLGSAALLVCLFAFLAALPMLVWALVSGEALLHWVALGLVVLAIASWIVHLIMAIGVRCPLCCGKPLTSPKCPRHRRASTPLGSCRLAVAIGVLARGYYRCPYCGEECECATREERPPPCRDQPSTQRF